MKNQKPRVIIVGGGYGGIVASRQLEKILKSGEADVTLINKHDYHYISTQLHKTGAGTSSDNKVALNIPELLRTDKVNFIRGTVYDIDFQEKRVYLENNESMEYDYLLIALGFDVNTFGIPGVEEHAFKIRSFRSSKAIHHHIVHQFRAYKEDQDLSRLTFAVAGAGFTGIEMTGELIDIIPKLCKQFDIPIHKTRIINIEASNDILPFFDKKAINFTEEYLKKNQAEVLTNAKIVQCKEDAVLLENGYAIPCRTLIWSCGVRGNRLLEKLDLPLVRGKVAVDEYLRVKGMKNVFCVGDAAYCLQDDNTPVAATAQVAIQQAQTCGSNIAAVIRREQLQPFVYHHKGTVASIGSRAGVGNVFGLKITGLLASFMKHVIEARYLFVLGGPFFMTKQILKARGSLFTETISSRK